MLGAMTIQYGYSQTRKGSFLMGVTLSAKPPETNRYEFTVSPDVSYFVVDRLAVGLVAPVNYIHEDRSDRAYVRRITTYAIGPAVRYYFSFGSWAIFPTASFAHGWRKTKFDGLNVSPWKGKSNAFTGGVGVAYFLTRSVGVEAVLYHRHEIFLIGNPNIPLSQQKVTKTGLNLSIGVQVYIAKAATPVNKMHKTRRR